ncbi:hypothetical protein [Corallococcus sp. Z5C101001]|uniref:hypothetical protein n=1 Tax=Corallococcus sp. Z5C101001 TaxID=2596829 RepID=UPI00117C9E01|nr:hypothetical protein [Corallococcus sp. Z5C101001]TSC31928.1 hypothetical protein FOF48_15035 [Corallococcus sp. Z5C101001]
MKGDRAAHLRGQRPSRQRRRASFLGWVVATCLLALHAAAAPAPDQIQVERKGELLSLSWRDAEDQLTGLLTPALPRPGEPLRLTLSVGNLQGPPFQGAVTVAFSREGVPGQVTRTLTRDAVGWSTEFVPDAAGIWDVDVRFLTTRPKALHARFTVSEPPVPTFVWRTLLAIAAAGLLVRVLRAVTRREGNAEPPPAEPASSAPATSEPPASDPVAAESPAPAASEPPAAEPAPSAPATSEPSASAPMGASPGAPAVAPPVDPPVDR